MQNRSTIAHIMETWQKRTSFLQNISHYLVLDLVPYFLLELKKVDVRLKKKKMKFCKETLKKTNNIVQNQEQE